MGNQELVSDLVKSSSLTRLHVSQRNSSSTPYSGLVCVVPKKRKPGFLLCGNAFLKRGRLDLCFLSRAGKIHKNRHFHRTTKRGRMEYKEVLPFRFRKACTNVPSFSTLSFSFLLLEEFFSIPYSFSKLSFFIFSLPTNSTFHSGSLLYLFLIQSNSSFQPPLLITLLFSYLYLLSLLAIFDVKHTLFVIFLVLDCHVVIL